MSEFEEKTWIMSRIELITKTTIEEWRIMDNSLQQIRREEKEKINDHRNIVLSLLGISLSILLALNTNDTFDQSIFFGLLIVIAVIGFVTLWLSAIYRSGVSGSFIFVENQVVGSIDRMSKLLGYINIKTVELDKSDTEFLKNFLDFGYCVGVAQLILIKNSFEIVSKNRFLTKFSKITLQTNSISLKDEIDKIISVIEGYEPDNNIPKEWYEEFQKTIASYKKTFASDSK